MIVVVVKREETDFFFFSIFWIFSLVSSLLTTTSETTVSTPFPLSLTTLRELGLRRCRCFNQMEKTWTHKLNSVRKRYPSPLSLTVRCLPLPAPSSSSILILVSFSNQQTWLKRTTFSTSPSPRRKPIRKMVSSRVNKLNIPITASLSSSTFQCFTLDHFLWEWSWSQFVVVNVQHARLWRWQESYRRLYFRDRNGRTQHPRNLQHCAFLYAVSSRFTGADSVVIPHSAKILSLLLPSSSIFASSQNWWLELPTAKNHRNLVNSRNSTLY